MESKVDEYLEKHSKWKPILSTLRKHILKSGLEEKIKWGMPTYTIDNKNLIGLAGFKNHCGVWFHQGVFLNDHYNVLVNAQKDKTKGMRHIKYTIDSVFDETILKDYIHQTIINHRNGLSIKNSKKAKKAKSITPLMKTHLSKKAIQNLTNMSISKTNDYIDYIINAKRETTKMNRLQKINELLEDNKALNDAWKKTIKK